MASIQNHELVDIIKKWQGDQTLAVTAANLNIAKSALSETLNGRRPVSAKLAAAFGYKRMKTTHITFAKRGK